MHRGGRRESAIQSTDGAVFGRLPTVLPAGLELRNFLVAFGQYDAKSLQEKVDCKLHASHSRAGKRLSLGSKLLCLLIFQTADIQAKFRGCSSMVERHISMKSVT